MVVELAVETRESKKSRALRREGKIPATLYGPDVDPQNLQLSAKDFSKVPVEDYNHMISLKMAAGEHEALIKDIQRNFVTREVENIQFYKIKRGHKVNLKVVLKIVGVSNAVKLGADLVVTHKEAHIRCFPRHIPSNIEVDITALQNDGDHICFSDLKVNRDEIEILDPAHEVICKAQIKKIDHTIEPVAPIAEAAPAADAAAAKPDEKKPEAKK